MKALSQIRKKSSSKPPNPHGSWHVFHVLRGCIDLYLINHSCLDHEYLTQQNDTTKFCGRAWALNFLWFIIHLLPQRYSSKVLRVSCNLGKCSYVNIISSIQWAHFTSWERELKNEFWKLSNMWDLVYSYCLFNSHLVKHVKLNTKLVSHWY